MVNIAYSDCSADGNSGLRQVLLFFLEYFGSYEENQGECSFDKPLGGPQGAPKVPPRPYAEKNFVFKSGVQTTQNALICLDPLSWKTLFWKKNLKIFLSHRFGAKIVNIAFSDCSADANSGLRQVLCFFSEYFGSYEEYQGEGSSDQPLRGPKGAPKVPLGP